MAAIYVIGLLVALLVGGSIGSFIMVLRNDRAAEEYRAYEQELADHHQDLLWFLEQRAVPDNDTPEV